MRRTSARYGERFTASSFAEVDNLTLGDVSDGEDPIVRASLIDALGNMNGTALAIDPNSGRILAMVNQKLALSPGAEPCSTIKLSVALAALDEGIVKRDTPVNLGGGYKVDMTYALARSVNPYFEELGRTLGFERVKHYANSSASASSPATTSRASSSASIPTTNFPPPRAASAACAPSARASP